MGKKQEHLLQIYLYSFVCHILSLSGMYPVCIGAVGPPIIGRGSGGSPITGERVVVLPWVGDVVVLFGPV